MSRKTDKIEIMAPAGDRASFQAAIQGGADSIYFGIGNLNMRARSTQNFSIHDLPELSASAALHGVKTYLTLNTILYDQDLSEMRQIIDRAKEFGITAIIASDPAAMVYAKKSDVNVHVSTQSNISNIEMVEFYSCFADVMVLARELNLNQVHTIAMEIQQRQIKGPSGELIRLELFAHGALCMAISGKCYLSLHTVHSSANRGACKQQCRHAYEVKAENGKELLIDHEYIMSPKDLCTIDFLDKIIDSGVRILKIEGRGRAPEYVKTVTRIYKDASEAVLNGNYTEERIRVWKNELNQVYNRGFWDGYYLGRKLGEWSSIRGSSSTKMKVFIGKVLHYYPKSKVAHVRISAKQLQRNDEVLIIGNTTGVVRMQVASIWVNESEAILAQKGEDCTITVPERVRKGDSVYVWTNRNHLEQEPIAN